MHPAFSVIFLTTLIGAGQGLFLALFSGQLYSAVNLLPAQSSNFYVTGSIIALVLMVGGLAASFWHLGRPERAWRAASQWRTSWLSREVIILPAVMGLVFIYGVLHLSGWQPNWFHNAIPNQPALIVGAVTTLAVFALYIATGMIYASIKFLQEWASVLTVINYTLLGAASGFTLATALAAWQGSGLTGFYGTWAVILTLAGLISRAASLYRNARIKYKSTVQSAIGMRHNAVVQKSMGMMGGSYNTREYFHGASAAWFKSIKYIFLVLVFPVPLILLWAGLTAASVQVLAAAFVVQYVGLLFERWFFFAQANHPQNLYYQTI
ncbi:MAG: DmsC/YnfH family molybdoenzyme membrane anchor subunit [Thiohalophilus sp.]|uniref:dimethyl sulfoxide reductase anchor subunit family protein n=1 Tax=Thiohalophilus sp. TaxID=3028392 RepID=UPI00286FFECB|nr:DmsC/YnfH family molybdoenzyme membrane anchor subunit [Thiohalophilus sp.]MDR9436385.1 DmsC/YnfH family molybdoenzyme membrane anchor subunit [Thiohalophilus sp.]